MRHMIAVVAASMALTMVGCVQVKDTQVRVFHERGPDEFQMCSIHLGWTLERLLDECGRPDKTLRTAGTEGGRCLVYRTRARNFASGTGAHVVAACVERDGPVFRVTSVIGLDDVPGS